MSSVQLEKKHFDIVAEILGPLQSEIRVFGSRAKGMASRFSDLDLCLMTDPGKAAITKLKSAFEESNLPFKVDVVVWSQLDESFRSAIQDSLISWK